MKKNLLAIAIGGAAVWYFFLRKKAAPTTTAPVVDKSVPAGLVPLTTGKPMQTDDEIIRQRKISMFPSKTISTANNAAQNAYILEGQAVKPPYPIMDIYMIMNGQKIPFNGWNSYVPYAPYLDIPLEIFDPIPYGAGNFEAGRIVNI